MSSLFDGQDVKFLQEYHPQQTKPRFLTATALFDGHDASINIMRRLLQLRGCEVVHLGHNRSAQEIAKAAIEEDVHGVAISSYQGGHLEFFKYLRKLLDEMEGKDIHLFGGGGGVIIPREIEELEKAGITKIYSPEDGQKVGLPGIIGHMVFKADFIKKVAADQLRDPRYKLARALSAGDLKATPTKRSIPVVGITGTGGAGKSSLTDELLLRLLWDNPELKIGVICVDPSKKKTGGALLGDRIRMNTASREQVFLRSFATGLSGKEIGNIAQSAIDHMAAAGFDLLVFETSGIGQGDSSILEVADISLYVMTPEYGASTQLEKIDMLDFADLIAVNKFERRQGPDAFRDVKEQIRRSRFQGQRTLQEKDYPVFATIASRFADDGTSGLYNALVDRLNAHYGTDKIKQSTDRAAAQTSSKRDALIPVERENYLSLIAQTCRKYRRSVELDAERLQQIQMLEETLKILGSQSEPSPIEQKLNALKKELPPGVMDALRTFQKRAAEYDSGSVTYQVRDNKHEVKTFSKTLSNLPIPKVASPRLRSWGDLYQFVGLENHPGFFPFTAGVFPFLRKGEAAQRMFAGEGGPLKTNKRFKYLSKDSAAKRLSTAFDSVTLYGADPDERPDIYGKVGESGVSIATLEDMKDLYKDFDLCDPMTSVSMTINGPAPIILAFFLNTAIDQQLEKLQPKTDDEAKKIRAQTLENVRGTVQADILKEDQAQNTCIFSTEFALKLMANVQEYFVENKVRNFYSVSISGYHIAEAGANPITQLALTLANGFTYVEYYLARGMHIDQFAHNLSFFFSNGLDAEYSVIGRVARRIWAVAMRDLYGAAERSQKLKYHIQTSGRSLHAMEIDFNDIRTTLQALLALYDNCNSLHTNAFDEAITTPTEGSVRRAQAIQLIIDEEFGPKKNENINQGSFFLEELTDLVEEAVLKEFESISNRGGVLGAMELQYQRSMIQEESLLYETQKDSGELKIIGVNTFLKPDPEPWKEIELRRASYEEKTEQINRLEAFQAKEPTQKEAALDRLAKAAIQGENVFSELMETVRFASLGEIVDVLYKVGGRYRRSM